MLPTTQSVRQSHASESRPAGQGLEIYAMLLYLHDQIGDNAKVPPYSLLEYEGHRLPVCAYHCRGPPPWSPESMSFGF